jgi:serine/threonine protein kinase
MADIYSAGQKQKLTTVFKIAKRNLKKQSRPIFLEEIIGYGGFALVAKAATDILLDGVNIEHKQCAVKIVYPHRVYGVNNDANVLNRTRFINEAFATRQVYINLRKTGSGMEKHIVRFFRYGEFDEIYKKKRTKRPIPFLPKIYSRKVISWRYIVSEYIDAKNLGEFGDSLSIKDIVHVGRIIGRVLEATHGVDLIHRDIKPANILIPDDNIEDLKLCDFGLAKRTDASIPIYSSVLGSLGFAAPEQIGPKLAHPVDERADIYGLAATLYFMITGDHPYNRMDAK